MRPHHKMTMYLSFHASTEDFYYITIPVRDLKSDNRKAQTTARVPLILPHELLHYLSEPKLENQSGFKYLKLYYRELQV